ncbi:MAG TPA: NAD-dependent epimerase/dehydratase family protein, partial [Kofleriaceae bacterium]
MSSFTWSDKRVLVTGGAGFFGSFVVDELRRRGATNVFVARSKDYNLVEREGCRRAIADAKPYLVF